VPSNIAIAATSSTAISQVTAMGGEKKDHILGILDDLSSNLLKASRGLAMTGKSKMSWRAAFES
jgi:hypothetical protein